MTPRIFFPLSGLSFVARYFVALCSNTHNKLKFSHVLLTFQAIARYCRDLQTKSNMYNKSTIPNSQRIVIHFARNAAKGGGVLMSIILPNLNHSFISPFPVPVPVPVPDPDFQVFHTPVHTLLADCVDSSTNQITAFASIQYTTTTLVKTSWGSCEN